MTMAVWRSRPCAGPLERLDSGMGEYRTLAVDYGGGTIRAVHMKGNSMSEQEWMVLATVVVALANVALVVVTTVYVIITGRIARASQQAAQATEQSAEVTAKTAEASLFAGFMSEYSSPQMHMHLLVLMGLHDYIKRSSANLATTCRATYASLTSGAFNENNNPYPLAKCTFRELDDARRYVDQYFTRAAALHKNGYVDDRLILAIASHASLDLWVVAIKLGQGQASELKLPSYSTWHVELFEKILGKKILDL
jgi:hypothetical protein